jgi:hypothetical protein
MLEEALRRWDEAAAMYSDMYIEIGLVTLLFLKLAISAEKATGLRFTRWDVAMVLSRLSRKHPSKKTRVEG